MKKILLTCFAVFLLAPLGAEAAFTRNLKLGDKGQDVRELQKILNSDPVTQIAKTGDGSPGKETTYFGLLTKKAVIRFQEKYKKEILTPNKLAKGTGVVGASTLAKLKTLSSGTQVVPRPVVTQTVADACADGYVFNPKTGKPCAQVVEIPDLMPLPVQVLLTSQNPQTENPSIAAEPSVPAVARPSVLADYFVSVAGAGSHDGSAANSFTLAEAQAFARLNRSRSLTFALAPGEYGSFSETSSRSAALTYVALDPSNKPIFRGSGLNPAARVRNASAANITFSSIAFYAGSENAIEIENSHNIKIYNSYIEGVSRRATLGYAVYLKNANNVTVADSTIHKGTNGVVVQGASAFTLSRNNIGSQLIDGLHFSDMTNFSIVDNFVHDTFDTSGTYGDSHSDSLQINAASAGILNGVIRNNRFHNGAGQGIFVAKLSHNQSYVIDSVTISENLITGTFSASPFQVEGDNLTITNNTIAASSPIASVLMATLRSSVFKENIVTGKYTNASVSAIQDYNIFGKYVATPQGGAAGAHDVLASDLRLDSDYRPLQGQQFLSKAGVKVDACSASSRGSFVGALPCSSQRMIVSDPVVVVPVSPSLPQVTPVQTASPVPPASAPGISGLVASYAFEGTVADSSGSGYGGALAGAASFVSGRRGQGLSLNGSSLGYAELPGSASGLQNLWDGGGSVSFWIFPRSCGSSGAGFWITKSAFSTLMAYGGSSGACGLEFNVSWSGGTAKWRGLGADIPITFNTWNHVVITYNADSPANKPVLYVNGTAYQGGSSLFSEVVAPAGTRTSDTGTALQIGSNTAGSRISDGIIDDVKFFNRSLSSQEVSQLYSDSL